MKLDRLTFKFQALKDYIRSRQRRVAAKVDLDLRGKPANVVLIAVFQEKSCLSEIIFRRDRLEPRIREPFLEETDTRRIASESPVGESCDFVIRNFHPSP